MRARNAPLLRIVLGLAAFVAGTAALIGGEDVVEGILGVLLGLVLFFGGLADRERQRDA